MMNMQEMVVIKPKKKGVLNRMLEKFAYRIKFNRSALNIQAVDLLRHEIEQQGLKQVDIANKLDMKPSALCRVLNTSEKNLELNTIADIATALNKRFSLELKDDRHAAALVTNECITINIFENQKIIGSVSHQQSSFNQGIHFQKMQTVDSKILTKQMVTS